MSSNNDRDKELRKPYQGAFGRGNGHALLVVTDYGLGNHDVVLCPSLLVTHWVEDLGGAIQEAVHN
jgi:hypothetical protein